MEFNQDYKEMLSILNKYKVRYLIIGAYATIYYTEPRYTKDIDIWVWREEKNINKLYKALAEFGSPLKNISKEDFMKKDTVYQIGIEPVRIDILTDLSGINFEEAWKARTRTKYENVPVNIVGLNNLIKSKKKTGRKTDEVDLGKLIMAKKLKRGSF